MKNMKDKSIKLNKYAIVVSVFLLFYSCSKKENISTLLNTKPVSIKKYDVPSGADSTVSAELGGNGFTGEGWETNKNYNTIGDNKAIKGGRLNLSLREYPVTFRIEGQNSTNQFSSIVSTLLHESLLKLDPVSGEYIPGLATHWKLADDSLTFRFRINPDARWADGKRVTSEDVIATWSLLSDPGILLPTSNILMSGYEKPVPESPYIVRIKANNIDWKSFYLFAVFLQIQPAHIIGNLTGKEYIEKFQNECLPGSGPYTILPDEVQSGNSIIIHRRSDYWAEKEKFSKGLYNFDEIRFEIIMDETMELEKFKKGDIDILNVLRSSIWEESLNIEKVNRGLILKKKIYNSQQIGFSGICLNMRKPPFDDINVRKAFCYLYDRKKFNEKLFFNSYNYIYSFFPGSIYENQDNTQVGFSLDSAVMLLEQSGWKEKNSDGIRTKNGNSLEFVLPFVKGMDRYYTIYQEDCARAGIKLNLRQVDNNLLLKIGNELNFEMLPFSWSYNYIPNPVENLGSANSDSAFTLNWSGIKDKKIDSLCEQYRKCFNSKERIQILREIDKNATAYFGYVFGWNAPFSRIAFHNKFSYPECIISRTGDGRDVLWLWYYDQDKIKEYEEAKSDNSKILQPGNIEDKYWLINNNTK